MSDTTYNGWTNYETWLVNLWLDNDGGSNYYREIAQENELDTYDLSKVIKETIEADQPESTGMYADMIGAAISKVNFFEIAEHYTEE